MRSRACPETATCGRDTVSTSPTADFSTEIGHPDLRGTRTPSDAHPGAFFFPRPQREFFERARGIPQRERLRSRVFPTSEASCRERPDIEVHARVRQQRIPPRGAKALRRDARRGRRRENAWAHELPVGDSRQCGASIERYPAVWACVPSGARGAAVAYAEYRERLFRDDGSSVG